MRTYPTGKSLVRGSAARRPEFTIRSGVTFPNWDAVHSDTAETALMAMCEAVGVGRRWTGHKQAEDRVYCAILMNYVEHACAPSAPRLSETTGMALADLHGSLRDLEARDLIVLDETAEAIAGAYPFTERKTEHCVVVDGRSIRAMCAVDALGAPAMMGRDAAIESRCRACDSAIRIETRRRGMALAPPVPEDALVWLDLRHSGGCSATSLCMATAFFCSDTHLRAWRNTSRPAPNGYRLSLDDAHQVGVAIFSPRLATSASNS